MNAEQVITSLANWTRNFGGEVPPIEDIEHAILGEVDEETRASMAQYAGRDLWHRRTVEAEVMNESSDTWTLPEFQAMLEKAVAAIPPDKRASAYVKLADEFPCLTIVYKRPETDEEMAIRIGRALHHARTEQTKELESYTRLKAKFG